MFEIIEQPKRIKSIAVILPVLWLTVYILFEFLYPFEDAFFDLTPIFFLLVYFFIGFILLLWLIFRLCEYRDRFYLSGLIIITAGFLFAVNSSFIGYGASVSDYGETFRRNRQFERNLPIYEEIIAQAEKERVKVNGNIKGVTYSTEINPTVRVAFPLRGILDNWEGTVYDPTGEVLKAKGFDKNDKFYAPDEITKLFDGDLVSCRHIQGNYYRCWFT